MARNGSVTFEKAKESATLYVNSEQQMGRLLSKAVSKAKRNYESLLAPWESLHILLRMVRAQLAGKYSPPFVTILAGVAALIYFVEPFDMIADPVPVFGLLDDAAVITAVVRANLNEISRFRNWENS